MRSTSSRFAVGASAAALGLALIVPAAAATPARGHSRTNLRGSSPGWVTRSTPLAATPAATPLSLTITLGMRDPAGAAALAAEVSEPQNAQYGQYLSTGDFNAQFAPTPSQVAQVREWLTGAGLTVTGVAPNNRLVHATGSVAAAEAAFATTVADYRHDGTVVRAPQVDASVPDAVAPVVTGVSGLTSLRRLNNPSRLGVAPPPDAFVNGRPCSKFWAQKIALGTPAVDGRIQPYAPCGYVPSQLQGAYGLALPGILGLNGRGTTVAVVDAYAAPTIEFDANTYFRRHGVREFRSGQFTQVTPSSYTFGYEDTVNGDQCGENGWYGEETLDVEAVHAMAPGANIVYVAASSCNDPDLIDAINDIVANHRADIITNSWGGVGEPDPVADADLLQAYRETFLQAALQGIGVFFSSGDDGDETADEGNPSGVRTVDYPASDPWVTAVGGTSLAVGGFNNYLFETGWGTSKSSLTDGAWAPAPPGNWIYGSGGGTSRLFAQPRYQRGVVPASISNYFGTGAARAVPDVAALGDPSTGMLVGQTQTWPDGSVHYGEYRIGGTSLASPLMAGIEAVADQAAGHPHGFANPAIYRLAGSSAYHDITSPRRTQYVVRQDNVNGVNSADGLVTSLRALNQTQSLTVARGYDDVTGLGSPNGLGYVLRLGRGGHWRGL